jgi:hypothetical protein
MIIVGSFLPEPVGWLQHHQLYSGRGADIVMESITPPTDGDCYLDIVDVWSSSLHFFCKVFKGELHYNPKIATVTLSWNVVEIVFGNDCFPHGEPPA